MAFVKNKYVGAIAGVTKKPNRYIISFKSSENIIAMDFDIRKVKTKMSKANNKFAFLVPFFDLRE
jgi:hypothetical protein